MGSGRREFLAACISAVLAASRVLSARGQGLGQFALATPECSDKATVTPAVAPDGTFKRGAPRRASLIDAGVSGSRLVLDGTVTGLTCGRVKGAVVDVWQADGRGAYDMSGFRLRGYQLTDGQGQFAVTTIVPGAPAGRAPHLGLRVQAPGHADFWTELFFAGDPRNAHDSRFQPALALTLIPDGTGAGRRAAFSVVLDI
jgi:protocatechuate 3,4-dioxygenase beta subunit